MSFSYFKLIISYLGSASHDDDELASWLVLSKVGYGLGQRTTHAFLVYLGDLTADADLTLRAKHLAELLQRLEHTVGRLVENHGVIQSFAIVHLMQCAFDDFALGTIETTKALTELKGVMEK